MFRASAAFRGLETDLVRRKLGPNRVLLLLTADAVGIAPLASVNLSVSS